MTAAHNRASRRRAKDQNGVEFTFNDAAYKAGLWDGEHNNKRSTAFRFAGQSQRVSYRMGYADGQSSN